MSTQGGPVSAQRDADAGLGPRHPGAPLLTRGEFCAREIERKYGRGGMRCC